MRRVPDPLALGVQFLALPDCRAAADNRDEILARAAASAALPNTKLEVRNIASECSLNWLRTVPARTASVSMSYSYSYSSFMFDSKTKNPERQARFGVSLATL